MPQVITLNGVEYIRDYKRNNQCELPGCAKRIPFKIDSKGRPESSDKYNKKRGCCREHSRKIQQLRIKPAVVKITVDPFKLFLGV